MKNYLLFLMILAASVYASAAFGQRDVSLDYKTIASFQKGMLTMSPPSPLKNKKLLILVLYESNAPYYTKPEELENRPAYAQLDNFLKENKLYIKRAFDLDEFSAGFVLHFDDTASDKIEIARNSSMLDQVLMTHLKVNRAK